jgi:membrane protease YdiL (CAAX protease family)
MVPAVQAWHRSAGIRDAEAREVVSEVLLRIPFATALPEEVIFRGVLLAVLCRRHRPAVAASITSVVFGLWHIAPRFGGEPGRRFTSSPGKARAGWVIASVLATSVSGLGLAWLRFKSGSIVAPWVAHSTANGAGFLAAWLGARRTNRDGPSRWTCK